MLNKLIGNLTLLEISKANFYNNVVALVVPYELHIALVSQVQVDLQDVEPMASEKVHNIILYFMLYLKLTFLNYHCKCCITISI